MKKISIRKILILIPVIAVIIGGVIIMINKNNFSAARERYSGPTAEAYFAGGCFWCVESDFEKLPGVIEAVSGYSGGKGANPTYKDYGEKGHIEAVKIVYDPKRVQYYQLLEHYWTHIDPLDNGGQFCDRGHEYISAIFYRNQVEKKQAQESKKKVSDILGREAKTELIRFDKFWKAEEYHQDYHRKNPLRYNYYRRGCGRDQRVHDVWKGKKLTLSLGLSSGASPWKDFRKPPDKELRERLTDIQYRVTQKDDTEKPFDNEYWDNKREGIYVDVVSGEPLFSSKDKYKSGTGWPSFSKPIDTEFIVEKDDNTLFIKRTEIRSRYAHSHLGHVFDDGPQPTGKRYCMNSAALRFIPRKEMKKQGYGQYLKIFN